jgi:hypothetical protein
MDSLSNIYSIPPLTSFSLFPDLPTELQRQIWQIAIVSEAEESAPRNQRIAPDPPEFKRELGGDEKIQLSIINQPHELPTLLQVCSTSRECAERIYTRWPRYSGGYIYVDKARDIFHFAEKEFRRFWLLGALHARNVAHATISDHIALSCFKDQVNGVRHLAFDFQIWKDLQQKECRPCLYTFFDDMKTMTIAFHDLDRGRVADRRFQFVSREYIEGGEDMGSRRQRQGFMLRGAALLGSTFRASDYLEPLRKDHPEVELPVLKFAVPVEEREFLRLHEEDRFTSVMHWDLDRATQWRNVYQ